MNFDLCSELDSFSINWDNKNIELEEYMKKEMTLLIMAAGMGSRYGGLKQIEPVGPNGEFLIDYSIYDAIRAGFTKVVFVIKKENEEIFKETVGNRVASHIKVEYAFQDLQDVPEGCCVPEGREKPWGTGQAILCAKDLIDGPFAIINADDFYGRDAYYVMSGFLQQDYEDNRYCVVGYKVKNTLSENGSVKRAICLEEKEELTELIESNVIREKGVIMASPLDGRDPFIVEEESLVSMNMLGFFPTLFPYLEKEFPIFLHSMKDTLKSEFLIPDILYKALKENYAKVMLLSTDATWIGITYKEDKDLVVGKIQHLIENGEYPLNLW